MKRRDFLQASVFGCAVAISNPGEALAFENLLGKPEPEPAPSAFELDEVTISQLQEGMRIGKFSARSLASKYLDRIEDVDKNGPAINSVIEINPDALAIADSLDRERKQQGRAAHCMEFRSSLKTTSTPPTA